MELKRYTTEELTALVPDIFYDYMSSETEMFWDNGFKPLDEYCSTCSHALHKQYETRLESNNRRAKMYIDDLHSGQLTEECERAHREALKFLNIEKSLLIGSNSCFQKEIYRQTGVCDYSRSGVRIPLDKKLNSFYDDIVLEVLFYDDVCTLNAKFEEYRKLTTKAERIAFLKENTEITHAGLAYFKDNEPKAIISLLGNLNFKDERVKLLNTTLLKKRFSDFKNLTLKETLEIENNDLRQWLQSKIDMDKENLNKLSSQMIAGDLYEIYEVPTSTNGGSTLYIRYVCRSTGRVYYNTLVLRHLALSPYYDENNVDSYARAWWNLNNLGEEIPDKPIVRC